MDIDPAQSERIRNRRRNIAAIIAVPLFIVGGYAFGLIGAKGAKRTAAMSNMKFLAQAFAIYAEEHEDTFPPRSLGWEDALAPYARNPQIFRHPFEDNSPQNLSRFYGPPLSFAVNEEICGLRRSAIERPDLVPLIVETKEVGRNLFAKPNDPVVADSGICVVFVEGRFRSVSPQDYAALSWKPSQGQF